MKIQLDEEARVSTLVFAQELQAIGRDLAARLHKEEISEIHALDLEEMLDLEYVQEQLDAVKPHLATLQGDISDAGIDKLATRRERLERMQEQIALLQDEMAREDAQERRATVQRTEEHLERVRALDASQAARCALPDDGIPHRYRTSARTVTWVVLGLAALSGVVALLV